ncbi:MAG: hypothetical protein Ct9H90mP4_06970 [Gammaproteobacteria bacterium]|nr:MAG: hypothetical protein Ct9H90mP4_06970 [Gammaproteobacteria bacterium]
MAEIFSSSKGFLEQLIHKLEVDKNHEISHISLVIQTLNGSTLKKNDLSNESVNIINKLSSVIPKYNCKLVNEEDLFSLENHRKYILIFSKILIKQTEKDSFNSIEKNKIKDLKENTPLFTLVLDKEVVNFLELKE